MTEPYEKFTYLWPPRPEEEVNPDLLTAVEKRGWWLQCKRQGTCAGVWVDPDGNVSSMNRHNAYHKLWKPDHQSSLQLMKLPRGGYHQLVAELMHSKVKGGPRNTLYVFDILVHNGTYLTGTTFEERQEILGGLWPIRETTKFHLVVDDHLWIARNYKPGDGYRAIFDGLRSPMDEGVVLKDPKARLIRCSRPTSNKAWQVKCRR